MYTSSYTPLGSPPPYIGDFNKKKQILIRTPIPSSYMGDLDMGDLDSWLSKGLKKTEKFLKKKVLKPALGLIAGAGSIIPGVGPVLAIGAGAGLSAIKKKEQKKLAKKTNSQAEIKAQEKIASTVAMQKPITQESAEPGISPLAIGGIGAGILTLLALL
jgi:hypothetical protein